MGDDYGSTTINGLETDSIEAQVLSSSAHHHLIDTYAGEQSAIDTLASDVMASAPVIRIHGIGSDASSDASDTTSNSGSDVSDTTSETASIHEVADFHPEHDIVYISSPDTVDAVGSAISDGQHQEELIEHDDEYTHHVRFQIHDGLEQVTLDLQNVVSDAQLQSPSRLGPLINSHMHSQLATTTDALSSPIQPSIFVEDAAEMRTLSMSQQPVQQSILQGIDSDVNRGEQSFTHMIGNSVATQIVQEYGLDVNALLTDSNSAPTTEAHAMNLEDPSGMRASILTSQGESDFQPSGRRNLKRRAIDTNNLASTNDVHAMVPIEQATECTICMEGCSNFGPHRIVAFKCGHLFGQSCILRWMEQTHKGKKPACPTCKKTISKQSMIPIFTKNVVAVDTVELDTALLESSNYKKENQALQIRNQELQNEVAQLYLLRDAYKRNSDIARGELLKHMGELERLKNENIELLAMRSKLGMTVSSCSELLGDIDASPSMTISPPTILELPSERSTARTIQISAKYNILFVSLKNIPTGSHGILKINLLNTTSRQFYSVHSDTIRDFKVSDDNHTLILSTSQDKTLKLSSFESCVVIQSFALSSPGQSCCFDSQTPTVVYVGTAGNEILQFDTRSTQTGILRRIAIPIRRGRGIHSLHCNTMVSPISNAESTDSKLQRSSLSISHSTQKQQHQQPTFLSGGTFTEIFSIPLIRNDPQTLSQSTTGIRQIDITTQSAPPVFGECGIGDMSSDPTHPDDNSAVCTCMVYNAETQTWAASLRPSSGGTMYRIGQATECDSGSTVVSEEAIECIPAAPMSCIKYGSWRELRVPDSQRSMTKIHLFQLSFGESGIDLPATVAESTGLASGSASRSAHTPFVLHTATARNGHRGIHESPPYGALQNPTSLMLAVGNEVKGELSLWEAASNAVSEPWRTLKLAQPGCSIMDITSVYMKDGTLMLATLCEQKVFMWNLHTSRK
ncbi:hypothetical protein BASA61_003014 [Batrachochytrium salamandrivorans]|nr:hypothetical protein BASA61_003014 [Batrachochytrium salamandrivorans]